MFYSFINFSSALAADHVFFNSNYHRDVYLSELKNFLKHFPDNNELNSIERIESKSTTLHLGLDLQKLKDCKPAEIQKPGRAVILWNHRWEYDKNPEDFFNALYELDAHGIDFRLVVLGENFSQKPEVFTKAKDFFGEKILHFGYANDFETYAKWLWVADIVPVTSNQDFFGISVVEAMYCNCFPLLPKRLAFPEHIPEKFHSTFFYENQQDLVKRLQGLIFNVEVIRKQNTQHFIEHYDWKQIIGRYDSLFEGQVPRTMLNDQS